MVACISPTLCPRIKAPYKAYTQNAEYIKTVLRHTHKKQNIEYRMQNEFKA
jgi:hypothetical protein